MSKTHEEIWEIIKAYETRRYMAHDYDDAYKKLSDSEWSAIYEYLDWKHNGTPPVPAYLREANNAYSPAPHISEVRDERNQPYHNSMYDGSIAGGVIQLMSGLMTARVRLLREEMTKKEFYHLRNNTYKQINTMVDEYIFRHTQAVLDDQLSYIKERRDYFANKDLHNGWSGRESGECCDKCAMRPEHFTGRADALKAKVGCRNPFQLKEVCSCHIPVRRAVRHGIVEAHDRLVEAVREAIQAVREGK